MLGDEVEILHQRVHGGVEPVAVFQLKRKAFADVTCHDTHRFKALADLEDGLDIRRISAERARHFFKVGLAIACLVRLIDKTCGDQLVSLREAGHGDLFVKVLMQRCFRAERPFEIIIVGEAAAGSGLRPVGAGGRAGHLIGRRRTVRRGATVIEVFLGRIHCLARFIQRGIVIEVQLFALGCALWRFAVAIIAIAAFAVFEQGIALDLRLNELSEFDV